MDGINDRLIAWPVRQAINYCFEKHSVGGREVWLVR